MLQDLRCLTIELRETEIEALIRRGWLKSETRHVVRVSRPHIGRDAVTRNAENIHLAENRFANDFDNPVEVDEARFQFLDSPRRREAAGGQSNGSDILM